jgi:hypothetical protein
MGASASSRSKLTAPAFERARLGAAAHRRFDERFTEDAVKGVVGLQDSCHAAGFDWRRATSAIRDMYRRVLGA